LEDDCKPFKKLQAENEANIENLNKKEKDCESLKQECHSFVEKQKKVIADKNEANEILKEKLLITMQKLEQYEAGKTEKTEKKSRTTKVQQAVN